MDYRTRLIPGSRRSIDPNAKEIATLGRLTAKKFNPGGPSGSG